MGAAVVNSEEFSKGIFHTDMLAGLLQANQTER
jgi:hypothetical protein